VGIIKQRFVEREIQYRKIIEELQDEIKYVFVYWQIGPRAFSTPMTAIACRISSSSTRRSLATSLLSSQKRPRSLLSKNPTSVVFSTKRSTKSRKSLRRTRSTKPKKTRSTK